MEIDKKNESCLTTAFMKNTLHYEESAADCRAAIVHAEDEDGLKQAGTDLLNLRSGVVVVRVKEQLETNEVEQAIDDIRKITTRKVDGASLINELHTYGIAQQQFWGRARDYFTQAEKWQQDEHFMRVADRCSVPVRKVLASLQSALQKPLIPAVQGNNELLAANVRVIDMAEPHKDVINGTAGAGIWDIEKLQTDIAWNVHLQMPTSGGELQIYANRMINARAMHELISVPSLTIRPDVGDLVFFRSRVPHAVLRSDPKGTRLTICGRLGQEVTGKSMRYWA